MPTWDEIEDDLRKLEERVRDRKRQPDTLRTRGAVFIRRTGEKAPPYIAARKENKLRKQQAKLEREHAQHQTAVAQAQLATLKMELKRQGKTEEEADKLANDAINGVPVERKSKAQLDNERRVNLEAAKIFDAWDAGIVSE